MKHLLQLVVLLILCACSEPEAPATTAPDRSTLSPPQAPSSPPPERVAPPAKEATVAPPTNKPVGNDLNGDGETDYLEVFTTDEDNDGLGFKRQLIVYSGEGADRDAWYTAEEVILSTEHGGMMGDPLTGVDIENGTIVVDHFGGSRQKWNYTHRFRWQQGDFKLIGTTIVFGAPCDYFVNFDYNLSTGRARWEKEVDDCDSEADPVVTTHDVRKKIPLPSMDGFLTGQNEFRVPGTEEIVFY